MTATAAYHYYISETWTGRVNVQNNANVDILVIDRDTAIQAIRDILYNQVPSLVLKGHEYPSEDNLRITISDDFDWDITAADVLDEPIDFKDPEDERLLP